ncbi:MAG: tRNA (adenosine(37)-N6)-threonylcarbamoyltransferase complex dimerization subunit type 1 TsaB [Candidatus Omnitrophota bacterium]
MITILSLDTTSHFTSISVSQGDEIRLEYNFGTRDDLSEILLSAIDLTLNSLNPPLKLDDIDCFGVAIGPGLFTGIRIGMATLKGLIFGMKKPVVPVVTLNALAHKLNAPEGPIVSLIDAKRNEVYVAAYRFVNGELSALDSPALVNIEHLPPHLESVIAPDQPAMFIGSGAKAYQGFLATHFSGATIHRRSDFLASEICQIAYHSYQKKEYITDLQKLLPLYIRKPDAETNYARSVKNA